MDAAEVKKKVDRLAELDRQMVAVKGEMETIKAWFEKQATDDLRDTKSKTVEYWGSENSKVVRDRETNLHDNGKEAPGGCLQGLCKRRCFL